jgi:hypothetical protein
MVVLCFVFTRQPQEVEQIAVSVVLVLCGLQLLDSGHRSVGAAVEPLQLQPSDAVGGQQRLKRPLKVRLFDGENVGAANVNELFERSVFERK